MAVPRHQPPAPVIAVILIFVLLVPLGSWATVNMREWAFGGSPADVLSAPYFWMVLIFRLGGGFLLAFALWLYREPGTIWVTLSSVWLAGPLFQILLVGIEVLASSGGERSLPQDPVRTLVVSSIGPSIVTILLLAFPTSRRAYGLEQSD